MKQALRSTARHVRHAALSGLNRIGISRGIAASAWRRNRLLVLCYHGVSLRDEHEWHRELFVTGTFLRRRFELLRDGGYAVLPLGEAIYRLRRGELPPRSVALTFDDGFYNFLAKAVPLLEEFGYPATNYVSTYYCIRQRPILTLALRYVVWQARGRVVPAGLLPVDRDEADLRDSGRRARVASALINAAEELAEDRDAQQEWVADIAGRLGVDWADILNSRLFHLMSPEEIGQVARRGFDIQLHTHRHRTPRDKAEFWREIVENRSILERHAQRPATHFCYPSGDVDPMFLPWLRELGVESATTGVSHLATAADDVLLLPRFVDTMSQSEVMFQSWLSGTGEIFQPSARLRMPGPMGAG